MKKKIKKGKKTKSNPGDHYRVGENNPAFNPALRDPSRNPYHGMNPFLIESICDNED